jgi:hypothetical protein
MNTTTTTPSPTTTTPAATTSSSLAASAKFGTFAIVFGLAAPILYVVCEIFSLPLFTYHPATDRIDLGWAAGRKGEGPAMYWYGWTATTILGSAVLGALATLLPQSVTKRIPLALLWILPLLAFIPLAYALKPFWVKGGW